MVFRVVEDVEAAVFVELYGRRKARLGRGGEWRGWREEVRVCAPKPPG